MTRHIPNFLTLCNLICGSLGILFAFNDQLYLQADKTYMVSAESQLYIAGLFVLMAAIFDFLDGLAARLLNASSRLGADLDSFADLISFGLLPAVIAYRLLTLAHYSDVLSFETSIFTALPAIMLVVFAALRLAIFNNDTRQTQHFVGLPSPANGLFWAGIAIAFRFPNPYTCYLNHSWVLLLLVALFCYLMVSKFNMFSFKKINFKSLLGKFQLLLLALSLVLIIVFQFAALPFIVITYCFLSIILNFLRYEF